MSVAEVLPKSVAAAISFGVCAPRGRLSWLPLILLGTALVIAGFGLGQQANNPYRRTTSTEALPAAAARPMPHLELELVPEFRGLDSFPSVANSTILFLHVFKCAGTSLREVLINWAHMAGWSGAIVAECQSTSSISAERICLDRHNDLGGPLLLRQKWLVRGSKILAGHFFWDFRHYVTPPYLMVTTLRNPLELFVSSQQFKNRAETKDLEESTAFVSAAMRWRLKWEDPTDLAFIRRFLDQETSNKYDATMAYSQEETSAMAKTAVTNLNTFYVVGVVEQYKGFIEVLKRTMDPEVRHPQVWEKAVGVRDNGSPVHSGDVLRGIDPDLLREFNSTCLGYQWQVYEVALQLWDHRCREVLPVEDHASLCTVPGHP